jgi:predicted lipid-binding transport protein (Tim44 family)
MSYAKHEEEKKKISGASTTEQLSLFSDYNGGKPETEWQDMPEFVQEAQKAYQKIIIRFDCEQDVKDFAKLIGQNVTPNTSSIWFPKLINVSFMNKGYIDES